MSSDPRPPPMVLPYADTTTPPGVDRLQVTRVHDDVRRVVVPNGVAFEVTPFAFRLAVAGPAGPTITTWPRSFVHDVHVNRYNGRLVLKIEGQDPLEVRVGSDPALTELVMHEVIASLTVIPVAPRNLQAVPEDASGAMPPSPARSRLLWAAAACAFIALVALPLEPIVSIYVFILTIVGVGIAFGTQRKDLWA